MLVPVRPEVGLVIEAAVLEVVFVEVLPVFQLAAEVEQLFAALDKLLLECFTELQEFPEVSGHFIRYCDKKCEKMLRFF
jgi:tetrahydromethanopterin S-methyltransferase subunit B